MLFLFSEPTFRNIEHYQQTKFLESVSQEENPRRKISGNGARTTANFVKNKSNAFSNGQCNPLRSVQFVLPTVPLTVIQFSVSIRTVQFISSRDCITFNFAASNSSHSSCDLRVGINEISEFEVRAFFSFLNFCQLEERSGKED